MTTPKVNKSTRSELIGVRVSPEEKAAWTARAAEEGIKVTEWLRQAGELSYTGELDVPDTAPSQKPTKTLDVVTRAQHEAEIATLNKLYAKKEAEAAKAIADLNKYRHVPAATTKRTAEGGAAYAKDPEDCEHKWRSPGGKCMVCGHQR